MTRTSIILCAVVAIGAALVIDAEHQANLTPLPTMGEEHQMHNLQVLALGMDDYHYEFRDEHGTVFWVHFCRSYEPQFAPGMTLTVLTYQDMGECWDILNTHPAYLIKRDKKGKIIEEDFHVDRTEASTAAH